MPDITINGDTYTCNEINIGNEDDVFTHGSSDPIRSRIYVRLQDVTHINGVPMKVSGGFYSAVIESPPINLDAQEQ